MNTFTSREEGKMLSGVLERRENDAVAECQTCERGAAFQSG